MYCLLFIVFVSIIVVVPCIFLETATVKMEKLEIGYEQKLHAGRPYLAQPVPCHVTFLSLFGQTILPSR